MAMPRASRDHAKAYSKASSLLKMYLCVLLYSQVFLWQPYFAVISQARELFKREQRESYFGGIRGSLPHTHHNGRRQLQNEAKGLSLLYTPRHRPVS